MLNEGEVGRRNKSMVGGGLGSFDHFRDKPAGLEGVTGGGAGAFLVCWRGLGMERSTVWVEGALGVEGPGRPSWPTSMASSLSEEASDSSSLEGGGGSGSGGGIGLALHPVEMASLSLPLLGQWGGVVRQQPETVLESPPLGQGGFWHP